MHLRRGMHLRDGWKFQSLRGHEGAVGEPGDLASGWLHILSDPLLERHQ